jgi:hypothetical protein
MVYDGLRFQVCPFQVCPRPMPGKLGFEMSAGIEPTRCKQDLRGRRIADLTGPRTTQMRVGH